MTLLQAVKDYRVVRDFFEKPIQTGAMIGAISIIATAALSLYVNTRLLATTGQGLLATFPIVAVHLSALSIAGGAAAAILASIIFVQVIRSVVIPRITSPEDLVTLGLETGNPQWILGALDQEPNLINTYRQGGHGLVEFVIRSTQNGFFGGPRFDEPFIQQLILKTNAAEVCREDIWNAVFAANRVDLLVWWTHCQDFNSQTLPSNVLGFVGVAQDNLEWVKKACVDGLDINSTDVMPGIIGRSPSLAMLAVEHGRPLEFIQALFARGATNDIGSYSDTVMRFAAQYGRTDVMDWLVQAALATIDDIPTRSVVQEHEVQHDVDGDPGVADVGALEGDEKSRFQGKDGPPLMCAIKEDQREAALWLIEQGADLEICDATWSRGPLDYAALVWKSAERGGKADAADKKASALAYIAALEPEFEEESVLVRPREVIAAARLELKLDFLETTAWADLESDLERKLVLIAELSHQRKGLGVAGDSPVHLRLTRLCIDLAQANLDWSSVEAH